MGINIAVGDVLNIIRLMDDNSMDGMLTDPPYGMNLLGKNWDKVVPPVGIWKEFFRIMKPGGLLLAFGGSRTHHRLMVNLDVIGYFRLRLQIG